jgi:hypothetical protein
LRIARSREAAAYSTFGPKRRARRRGGIWHAFRAAADGLDKDVLSRLGCGRFGRDLRAAGARGCAPGELLAALFETVGGDATYRRWQSHMSVIWGPNVCDIASERQRGLRHSIMRRGRFAACESAMTLPFASSKAPLSRMAGCLDDNPVATGMKVRKFRWTSQTFEIAKSLTRAMTVLRKGQANSYPSNTSAWRFPMLKFANCVSSMSNSEIAPRLADRAVIRKVRIPS